MAIEVTAFRALDKGTLRGFLSIRMTNIGMEIHDATLHEKNGRRWIGLPSKSYQKADGSQGWAPLVSFYDRGMETRFRDATLKALERFQHRGGGDEREPF